MVHQVAYQLIVTHRGPVPNREHPPNEWEFSNPRFNGQKRSEIRAIAIAPAGQRYGWARGLSTAARAAGLKPRQRLQRAHNEGLQIDKRPWEPAFSGAPRLFPKISAGGCREGPRTSETGHATCQGFHHFDRLFALPIPHDWASVPPPRTALLEQPWHPRSPHDFEDKDFP